jgi:hypothetical protein
LARDRSDVEMPYAAGSRQSRARVEWCSADGTRAAAWAAPATTIVPSAAEASGTTGSPVFGNNLPTAAWLPTGAVVAVRVGAGGVGRVRRRSTVPPGRRRSIGSAGQRCRCPFFGSPVSPTTRIASGCQAGHTPKPRTSSGKSCARSSYIASSRWKPGMLAPFSRFTVTRTGEISRLCCDHDRWF